MSRDKDFKHLVRRRMRKTGESYTAARAHLLGVHAPARRTSMPQGGAEMFPFERFTEPAKKALTAAQAEADSAGSGYIGTEHLLLGLLADPGAVAAKVLRALGVEDGRLRDAIRRLPAEDRPPEGEGLRPTEPVKRVIEFAFTEAMRIGSPAVGTGHLLVGILLGATGVGARALAEVGVTTERVRGEVDRLAAAGLAPEPQSAVSARPLGLASEVAELFASAQQVARDERAQTVRIDHFVRALAGSPATSLLGQIGVDLPAAMTRVPVPPPRLLELQASASELAGRRSEAGARQDDAAVAELREAERRTTAEWEETYRAWMRSWGSGSAG